MVFGWSRRDPWFPAFVLAVAAFILGSGLLVLGARGDLDPPNRDPDPAVAGARSTVLASPTPAPLRHSGELPAPLAGLGLLAADATHPADVTFGPPTSPDATPLSYFALVASPHAGIDALTAAQAQALLGGRTSFEESGGVGGKARVLVRTADAGAAARVAPDAVITSISDEAALRTEFTNPSRPAALALVRLDAVRPWMTAVAIDGVDIVRGRGDPSAWPFVERVEVKAATPAGREKLAEITSILAAKLPIATTVVATGDILMSRCSLAGIRATGDWAAPFRGPVGAYLAAANLTLGSLDGSIQDIGEPYGCIETTNLTSPPEVMEALKVAGFDGVTVATNHVFDCGDGGCGSRALLRTLELLEAAGIKHVGGGRTLDEALAPAVFEAGGIRFGVLGFDDVAAEDLEATADSPGTAPLDDSYRDEKTTPPQEPAFYKPASMLGITRLQERIRKLKGEVDIVIVQIHSGTEDTHDPSPRSLKALRAAADAGADLVIGNQAHWAQAVEWRGDAFIAYALGNFVFDQRWTPQHMQGYLVEATFWGKRLANVRLVPYEIQDQYRPEFAAPSTRQKVYRDVYGASLRLPAPDAAP